ncbi:MAG: TonB-dependent receptor [Treponema sp.]|jgi:vitamin B12 transporter|nr:TonB-dependent receptor [Treponema sp.]
MNRPFFFYILSLLCLCPLFSQEAHETEEAFEDMVEEGEGVTVTGSAGTTQPARVITKEEIERAHAPTVTALLEELVDMGAMSYGPYGNTASVNMRGMGSGRVAVLIDGVPVNSAQSGAFSAESIGVDSIERIEVKYGGADTEFNVSGAMGGVINIITVKERGHDQKKLRFGGGVSNTATLPGSYRTRDGVHANAAYGDVFDTQHINAFAYHMWDTARDEFSVAVSLFANSAENHFLFDDYYGITRRRINNETRDGGGRLAFTWDFANLARLSYTGDLYAGDKNIPGPMTATAYGKQKDFSTRHSLFFDTPAAFRDDLAVEATVSYALQRLGYEESAAASLHTLCAVYAANRWTWYTARRFTLKTGWDYAYNYLDSTNTGVIDAHNEGVYLTGEWDRGILIIPSVKLALDRGGVVPIPKLGVARRINGASGGAFSISANAFRVFKFPTFNDRYWSGDATAQGNPDLRSEDGWGADIGAAYAGAFTVDAAVYASYIRDSIHWRSRNGVWQPVNIGEAALFGADVRIQKEFALHRGGITAIVPSVSYQYVRSYILTEDFTFASNIRMPYMPEHAFSAALEARWNTGSGKEGSVRLSGHYTGTRYTETLNVVRLKPYMLLNAALNQRITARLTAFLALRNLLNMSYVSIQDYPMPGFTVTMGMSAKFER